MARTTNLRRQHDAATLLIGQIRYEIASIGHLPTAECTYQVSLSLAKLTGTLRLHFAAEDRQLYPSMMAVAGSEAAVTARRFFEEMGSLGSAFMAFTQRWNTGSAIEKNWAKFSVEAAGIFKALENRIQRENEELYPLADAIDEFRNGLAAA